MPKAAPARKAKTDAKAAGGKKKKGMSFLHSNCCPKLTSPLDANAPKRGLSAYMFFANEQREKVRADNPNMKFGESFVALSRRANALTIHEGDVGKVLGQKWKELNDSQKGPYEKKAIADKKRYEEEKAAYNAVSHPRFPALQHNELTLIYPARR